MTDIKEIKTPSSSKKKKNSSTVWRRFCKNKSAVVGAVIFILICFVCLAAPLLTTYEYDVIDYSAILQKPSMTHWFGTDDLGRDLFSRVLYGGRYTLLIAFGSTAISCLIGIAVGALAGYIGGAVDIACMRVLDVIQSLPNLVLMIAVAAALGTGTFKTLIVLGICGAPGYARMLRASILSVRKMEYIEAAQSINCTDIRIIIHHVLPNALSPIIVQATMGLGQSMLAVASLSFVGLGVRPPDPEWGALLSAGRNYIRDYSYLEIFPGLMIMLSVLATNLMGDALRDAMDPKLKK